MPNWNCSSSLCFNTFRSGLKPYRLPRKPDIQREYKRLFKTEGWNWKDGYICPEHWENNKRNSSRHLPTVIVPPSQLVKMNQLIEDAKNKYTKNPSSQTKAELTILKNKLVAAQRIIREGNGSSSSRPKRRIITKMSPRKPKSSKLPPSPKKRTKSSATLIDLQREVDSLKTELSSVKQKLQEKSVLVSTQQNEILLLRGKLDFLKKLEFSYDSISKNKKKFNYLCGLSLEQFDMLFECIKPYLSTLPHTSILFDMKTQYLAVLTICRHALDYRFMASLLNTSEATMSRMGNAWIVFLATIFNQVDIKPNHGYLVEKMPQTFIETGHGLTDVVLDATEFKFHTPTNYDVNSLMFSNYKNHSTGKALIGITPHGMGLLFSDVYPGSISDTEITMKTNVIDFLFEGHELMTDRGFSVQDYCAEKGITLNRPKQKDNPQYLIPSFLY